MDTEQGKRIVRRFVERVQAGRDLEVFRELIHPGFVDHSRPPGVAEGPEGVLQQFQGFWAAFPDLRVTILRQVAEGETVVTHKVFSGTYQGGLLGIPAQPGTVDLPVMDMIVVRDGRIVEHWGVLGLAPLLAAAAAAG